MLKKTIETWFPFPVKYGNKWLQISTIDPRVVRTHRLNGLKGLIGR